jgi:hypothetical protein
VKIWILPVLNALRPERQSFDWPPDNNNWGVEQDFLEWLWNSEHVTDNRDEADWDYLGPFYNRWYMNRPDDNRSARGELQNGIDFAMRRPERTFTICEYDPYGIQRDLDLHGAVLFTANRCHDYPARRVFDIPLLVHPHALPPPEEKKYLLSFVGHLGTDPIRHAMLRQLYDKEDCYITGESHGIDDFVRVMRQSYVALAPRGDGAQSFRFYEAMQAGVVPLYLSDIDARPFKKWVDWDSCSLWRSDCDNLCDWLHDQEPERLLEMGRNAAAVYERQLAYGRWEEYVVRILEEAADGGNP